MITVASVDIGMGEARPRSAYKENAAIIRRGRAAAKSYSGFSPGNSLMSQPTVTIRCRENGPLVVALDSGVPIQIVDHLGQTFTIAAGKTNVALCRCGASNNKPFCDGQH